MVCLLVMRSMTVLGNLPPRFILGGALMAPLSYKTSIAVFENRSAVDSSLHVLLPIFRDDRLPASALA